MRPVLWTPGALSDAISIHRGIENGARLTIEDVEAEIKQRKRLIGELEDVQRRHRKAADRLLAEHRRRFSERRTAA